MARCFFNQTIDYPESGAALHGRPEDRILARTIPKYWDTQNYPRYDNPHAQTQKYMYGVPPHMRHPLPRPIQNNIFQSSTRPMEKSMPLNMKTHHSKSMKRSQSAYSLSFNAKSNAAPYPIRPLNKDFLGHSKQFNNYIPYMSLTGPLKLTGLSGARAQTPDIYETNTGRQHPGSFATKTGTLPPQKHCYSRSQKHGYQRNQHGGFMYH